jgi:HemK-related putative methylase
VRPLNTEPPAPPVPAVYPAREDTDLLRRFASGHGGRRVLEIGTGGGSVAERAARDGAIVVATDLNPEALRSLRGRALREGFRLGTVRTDLADGLRRFDVVLANPPYLPTATTERDPDRWTNLALDGGADGCEVWARIIETLPEHLAPGGTGFVLESSLQDPERREHVREVWRSSGGRSRRVAAQTMGDETLEVWAWTRVRFP